MSLLLDLRRLVGGPVRRFLLPIWPREGEAWDRKAGIATELCVEIPDLTVGEATGPDGHRYSPTSPRVVRAVLNAVSAHGRTFVDMGSGRGRVLFMAAERPFRRVVGVEFAAELHESALENLERFPESRMRCTDVQLLHEDATTYRFPDGPLVVYFNNPFSEVIMERVAGNLAAAYAADPRPIVVVYQQQVREHESTATSNLALLDGQAYLTGRDLRFRLRDRLFLMPFVIRVFESPEARTHAADGPLRGQTTRSTTA